MVLLFGLVYSIIFIDSGFDNNEVHAESVTSTNSNASLTIAENDLHTTVAPGSVAYTSTNVSYSTTNVENYTLKISYAENYNALVGDSVDATVISDIANNTLSDNSWGYAWSDDNTITESNFSGLTYSSMPNYNNGNNLASGNTNISNGTGKLIFAAKFASNAVTTNYKTSILLTLATTPKAVTYTITYNSDGGTAISSTTKPSTNTTETLTISSTVPTKTGYVFVNWEDSSNNTYSPGDNTTLTYIKPSIALTAVWRQPFNGITQMQQMTTSICSAASIGDFATLTDIRDNNTYTIKKIGSKCWMAQNLRLSRESINAKDSTNTTGRITSTDSNISANYDIPASVAVTSDTTTGNDSASTFSVGNATQQVRKSTNNAYGAYYSWCAATAGTCSSATSTGAEVSYDICPKGWQLPSGKPGTGTSDFAVAAGLTSTSITASVDFWSSLSSPSFSGNTLTVNDNTWIAAGRVVSGGGGLIDTDIIGRYWSRTANSSSNAYDLYFSSSIFSPSYSSPRYYGYSIRCIAK